MFLLFGRGEKKGNFRKRAENSSFSVSISSVSFQHRNEKDRNLVAASEQMWNCCFFLYKEYPESCLNCQVRKVCLLWRGLRICAQVSQLKQIEVIFWHSQLGREIVSCLPSNRISWTPKSWINARWVSFSPTAINFPRSVNFPPSEKISCWDFSAGEIGWKFNLWTIIFHPRRRFRALASRGERKKSISCKFVVLLPLLNHFSVFVCRIDYENVFSQRKTKAQIRTYKTLHHLASFIIFPSPCSCFIARRGGSSEMADNFLLITQFSLRTWGLNRLMTVKLCKDGTLQLRRRAEKKRR